MTNTKPEIVPDVIPGAAMLDSLRDGQVVEEIGEGLRELAQLVLLHNKKGTLTVKFTIDPAGDRQIVVSDDISLTPPKAALPRTIRFVDEVGNFKTHDPTRPSFAGMRSLTDEPTERRSIDHD